MADNLEPAELLLNFKNSAKKPSGHLKFEKWVAKTPKFALRGKKRLFKNSGKEKNEANFAVHPTSKKRPLANLSREDFSEDDFYSDNSNSDEHSRYALRSRRVRPKRRLPSSIKFYEQLWGPNPDFEDQDEESDETRPDSRMRRSDHSVMQLPLSDELKESLRRLKNLLKLPKARRWVYCEFFYSDMDREFLLTDSEFKLCLRETFPSLKTRLLARSEWRQIRRLIGKPRRCSQAFFDEERQVLEQKRNRIRDIYKGVALTLDADLEIPSKIPRPFVVGSKVMARVHYPKDGVFMGLVDAVMDGKYRVVFEKDIILPAIVDDFDLVSEIPDELVPISFFLEKNKAAQPVTFRCGGSTFSSPAKIFGIQSGESLILNNDDPLLARPSSGLSSSTDDNKKCGNYPLRSIVAIVKLSKFLEIKKTLLLKLQEMNAEAERSHLYAENYLYEFQQQYAKIIIDLDVVNSHVETFTKVVDEFSNTIQPFVTDLSVCSRPETFKKLCASNAAQMVKQCTSTLQVKNKNTLDLITTLTGLLLQVRALGQQKCGPFELRTLNETINQIKNGLHPTNLKHFEDNVEMHLRHIEFTMVDGSYLPQSLNS